MLRSMARGETSFFPPSLVGDKEPQNRDVEALEKFDAHHNIPARLLISTRWSKLEPRMASAAGVNVA